MPIKTALIIIGAILLNYVAVMRFLNLSQIFAAPTGSHPVTKDSDNSTAIKIAAVIGISSTVILFLAVSLNKLLEEFILTPLTIGYLSLPACILLMFLLSQLIMPYTRKAWPRLHPLLDRFLPLIIFNSAALFIFFIYPSHHSSLIKTVFHSVFAGLGFTVIVMACMTMQQRIAWNELPVVFRTPFTLRFKGTAILLITAGLVAMSLAGFSNILFFDF